MIKQNETIQSVKILNEIIDNAAILPLECQDLILTLARGMVFTKKVITNNKAQPEKRVG